MKYSIRYYRGCRMLDKVDEIIILYTEKDKSLLKFIKKYSPARIVVNCTELSPDDIRDNLDLFTKANKLCDFAVLLNFTQKNCLIDLSENMIKYFFLDRVNTIDKLHSFINLGVSDVYITDELGFSLDSIGVLCHENNVNVRVYPNIAQSTSETPGNTFKYFYIRPEDVESYEPYVDYFEFYGALDRQSVLYKIYAERQWLGTLDVLIGELKSDIPNTCIVPYFGLARVKCGKRCSYNKNCNVCDTIYTLAKTLEERDLGITAKRKKIDERIKIKEDNNE